MLNEIKPVHIYKTWISFSDTDSAKRIYFANIFDKAHRCIEDFALKKSIHKQWFKDFDWATPVVNAEANLIVNTALPYLAQSHLDHHQSFGITMLVPVTQQEIQLRRTGKLRRAAETAIFRVKRSFQLFKCLIGQKFSIYLGILDSFKIAFQFKGHGFRRYLNILTLVDP